MESSGALFQTLGVTKAFGGPPVVREVDFDLRRGEVHAIVGENGAGKSTLLKLMAGIHQPDRGALLIEGRPVRFPTPAAAQLHGVALISQEPTLFPDLSVAENIFAGRLPAGRPLPLVRWKAVRSEAARILGSIGAGIDPDQPVALLSVAEQQLVEVAAALSKSARILLMDEPTASLTPREVERLFRVVQDLKRRGAAIAFVDHRLDEVFAIADRITVMRDGAKVGVYRSGEVTREEVVRRMVGREIPRFRERARAPGETLLEAERLGRAGAFEDVSLRVRRGEIVALAGLVGSGRTEVARAIFGIDRLDSGILRIRGKELRFRSPREALDAGVAYLPEDRQRQGLILPLPVAHNLSLVVLRELARRGWLLRQREQQLAQAQVERLGVKGPGIDAPARSLSGGNQQKVLVGKFLAARPELLILDEPTRGVDVGAKAEIHRLIVDLAEQGLGILMISSELPEVLALADRVLVMREGRVAAEFDRAQATEEAIMAAAVGALPVGAPVGSWPAPGGSGESV